MELNKNQLVSYFICFSFRVRSFYYSKIICLTRRYGLFLPKKTTLSAPVLKKPAVFDSESDEESNSVDWMSKTAKVDHYYRLKL